jgi:1,4-dihydroxy-2-naphthoyl-CoA hydrolase
MKEQAKSPWFRAYTVAELNDLHADTMPKGLGIEFTEVGESHISARMPVDHRTVQPYRLLHGGASVTLAESLGSVGATMTINQATSMAVGQVVNANHLRAVRSGFVTGTARPVHLGGRSQVWEIEIVDDAGRLVCVTRLTMAVLDRPSYAGSE